MLRVYQILAEVIADEARALGDRKASPQDLQLWLGPDASDSKIFSSLRWKIGFPGPYIDNEDTLWEKEKRCIRRLWRRDDRPPLFMVDKDYDRRRAEMTHEERFATAKDWYQERCKLNPGASRAKRPWDYPSLDAYYDDKFPPGHKRRYGCWFQGKYYIDGMNDLD